MQTRRAGARLRPLRLEIVFSLPRSRGQVQPRVPRVAEPANLPEWLWHQEEDRNWHRDRPLYNHRTVVEVPELPILRHWDHRWARNRWVSFVNSFGEAPACSPDAVLVFPAYRCLRRNICNILAELIRRGKGSKNVQNASIQTPSECSARPVAIF